MLKSSNFAAILFILSTGLVCHSPYVIARTQAENPIDFDKDILPILVSRCLDCHNPSDRKGDLDLTSSKASANHQGLFGSGKLENSLIWQQIDQEAMPPEKPLPAHEKKIIQSWIEQNGVWGSIDPIDRFEYSTQTRAGRDWWSLRPVVRPQVPSVKAAHRVKSPIDAFVLQKLESKGLELSTQADRATLLRRAYLDLIGLPPSPQELDQFLKDQDPDAFAKVVEQLLSSPHYGERWARHWLDVARYTESQGFEYDRFRPNAWHYRDYVIDAFNSDKRYDVFIKEQIAGDVLPTEENNNSSDASRIIATSLLVCGPWDQAGNGQANIKQRMATREEEMEDLVSVIGQTFLGLTINCARCHAHKFDPISQEEYYRFKACFEGVKHGERSIESAEESKTRKAEKDSLAAERLRAQAVRTRLEQETRQLVLRGRQSTTGTLSGPAPFARWSFEEGTRDSVGQLHGELHGGAQVRDGRLVLGGKGQFAKTQALPKEIREKSLEAWVVLDNRNQNGGGVLSLETKTGSAFDSIVYGERQPRKWMAGSNSFVRTRDLNAPEEDSAVNDVIHLAIVYSNDNQIVLYRNGRPYADGYDAGSIALYPANNSQVLLGLRHTGAVNGFLHCEIESASIYDRALTDQEVEASFLAGPDGSPIVRQDELESAMLTDVKKEYIHVNRQIDELNKRIEQLSKPKVSYVGLRQQPDPTHRLNRGDVSKPEEVVAPAGLLRLFGPDGDFELAADAPESLRRIKMADWLTDPRQPLTARVMVNRIWHYHFGRGIVETPNDLGFNGARPSHPELLDWLSDEFVRGSQPWSIKHMHRLILNSATYQQASAYSAPSFSIDADNSLLWRYTPRRLEGEIVRDCMLSVSGELNSQAGGPSVMPFKITSFNSDFYEPIDPIGPEFNRRSIYRANINSGKSAMMDSLDCPDPSIKTPSRRITTTPIAALALMNNSFVQRQAKKLAERIEATGPLNSGLDFAYQLCFARSPLPAEKVEAKLFIETYGAEAFCWAILNSTEFLYVD